MCKTEGLIVLLKNNEDISSENLNCFFNVTIASKIDII